MRRVFILYFCLALRRGRGASLAAPQPCPARRGARAAARNSGRCRRGPALAGKGGRPPARGWRGERGQAGERSLRGSSPSGDGGATLADGTGAPSDFYHRATSTFLKASLEHSFWYQSKP